VNFNISRLALVLIVLGIFALLVLGLVFMGAHSYST
jgi:hypothetical protein